MKKRLFVVATSLLISGCFNPTPPDGAKFAGKWINTKYKTEYLIISQENAPALTIREYSQRDTDPSPLIADLIDSTTFKLKGYTGTGSLLKNGTLLYTDKLFSR